MFRRKKIPPPLNPPKPVNNMPDTLDLPFELADQPRIVLDFLARNSELDTEHRELIAGWLLEYNQYLADWIMGNYGWSGVFYANMLSQDVSRRFYASMGEQMQGHMDSLFEFLEQDLGGEDGAGNSPQTC